MAPLEGRATRGSEPPGAQSYQREVSVRQIARRSAPSLAALLTLALVLGACGGSNAPPATTEVGAGSTGKIAFLLPERTTERYESQDRPLFQAKVKELCAECELLYSNADKDAGRQRQQAADAVVSGASVLVLDPVDSASAADIVAAAKSKGVAVIAYDRLIRGADLDYYVSFDNREVGRLQAQALTDRLRLQGTIGKGSIVVLDGSPNDNNAALLKAGAHGVFDGHVTIGREVDVPDWSSDLAEEAMRHAIQDLGPASIVGVHAANDSEAGGAIAAMEAAGMSPLPPVTGQDADLPAIQRVLVGEQYMTVYKAVKLEAEEAAQLAVALVHGGPAPGVSSTTDNGREAVPSAIFTPVAVEREGIASTVVKDGFWSVPQICTTDYVQACRSAGIVP